MGNYGFIELYFKNILNQVKYGCFVCGGTILVYIINQKQWSLETHYLNIKNYTIYNLYIFKYKNKIIENFFVSVLGSKRK